MRQPALIFDFGNVVGFFDYSEMFERFGRRLGVSPGELERSLYARGAARIGKEFELGRISDREFARQVMDLAGLEISFEEFEADWPDIFTLNLPVARLLAGLKRNGYTLLLGSNTNVLHARCFRRKFRETIGLFDHLALSYELGVMKPERAFFEACLALVGLPASACVFIDDAEPNVAGAKAAGLHGIVYREPAELKAELGRLGVEVPDLEA